MERSRKLNRIEYIEGNYVRTLALCHSGKFLYQDNHPIYEESNSENPLNIIQLNTFLHKHRSLTLIRPRIRCFIDKERYIYDRDMPHLSYEIDDIKNGDLIIAMIVENKGDGKLSCTL